MPGTLPLGKEADDDDRPTLALDRGEGTEEAAARRRAAALIGKLIGGRYRIEALLGEGGMGTVYRGEHTRMRKRVAIKILRPDAEQLPDLVARFEREAIAGAQVEHPNVAAATDFGQLDDGGYFLVLELVKGEPLADVIARGAIPPQRAARIARAVAEALAAVHKKGVIHRDVKPLNVMIGDDDAVKLIDFGLARVRPEALGEGAAQKPAPALTGFGTVVGTIAYLAPEAALGMDAVDERADLYALGVILYELLTGVRPFVGSDDRSVFRHQRFDAPLPMAERAPGVHVPPILESIAMRLLAKNPDDRFQRADHVVRALEPYADGRLPIASEPPSDDPPSIPGVGRGGGSGVVAVIVGLPLWIRALLAAGALAVFLALVAGLSRTPTSATPAHEASAPAPAAPVAADPAASATAASAEPASATALRAKLHRAADAKNDEAGARAFLALVDADPAAFSEGAVKTDAIAIAAGAAFDKSDQADRLFDAMADRLGATGPDLLYEIVRSRGGTRSARRAQELLRRPDVLARGTPALRVAVELKAASCTDKRALFSRAEGEGDGRALVELVVLKDTACKKKDPCCFHDDAELASAVKRLKAKLR